MPNALKVSPFFLNDMAFLDSIPRLGPVIKMTVDSDMSVLNSGLNIREGLYGARQIWGTNLNIFEAQHRVRKGPGRAGFRSSHKR